LCLVTSVKLCLESRTFKVYFVALYNDLTHVTMFDTFAQDLLNSLQKKMVQLYCTKTLNFSFI